MPTKSNNLLPLEQIASHNFLLRGEKVMFDFDLARLYGLETKVLKRAVQLNIAIMRAFVQLRQMIASHSDLARKLATLERKYDSQFKIVFDAIRALMADDEEPALSRRIGFGT